MTLAVLALLAFAAVSCQQRQEVDDADADITITEDDTSVILPDPAPGDTSADTSATDVAPDTAATTTAPPGETSADAASRQATSPQASPVSRPAPEKPAPAPEASVSSRTAAAAPKRTAQPKPSPASEAAPPSETSASEGAAKTDMTAAPSDTPPGGRQSGQGGTEQGGGQAAAETQGEPSLVVSAAVYQGWKQFSANCERCHGQDALGSSLAPDLRKSITSGSLLTGKPLDKGLYAATVLGGRPEKGMPAWQGLLNQEQVEQIWLYLNARASKKLPAGRPKPEGS